MIFDHPWLGGLFGESKVIDLWSAECQLDRYRAFEVALANALEACGRVPVRHGHLAAEAIENAEIDMASLAASTTRDGLPIPDFVRQLRSQAGEFQTAIHTGATSQDVLDTALALTLRDVSLHLIEGLNELEECLAQLVSEKGDASLMIPDFFF